MTEKPNYETPEKWVNYGDINPERHGGFFVKWERDMWHIIETRHFADLPKGISDNEHMFDHMFIEPQDIWAKGNPYYGFTDKMKKGLDSFNNLPFDILSASELPEGEKYQDYVDWYISNHFTSLLGNCVHVMIERLHGNADFAEDYWGYLNNYGIEKEDF